MGIIRSKQTPYLFEYHFSSEYVSSSKGWMFIWCLLRYNRGCRLVEQIACFAKYKAPNPPPRHEKRRKTKSRTKSEIRQNTDHGPQILDFLRERRHTTDSRNKIEVILDTGRILSHGKEMDNSWIGTQWTYYGIVISPPPHTHTRTHTDFLRNIFSSEFVSCLTKFSPSHFTELSLKKWDLDWAESYTATGLLSHQDTGYTQYNFIGQEQTIKNTICFSRFFFRA